MYGTRWGQLLGNRTGVAVGTSDQAWDPAVTEGPLVLSANDCVVVVQAPGAVAGDGTKGTISQGTGAVYWEIVLFSDNGGSDATYLNVGLIDEFDTVGTSSLLHTVIASISGSIYGNDDTIGGWVIPGVGDVICLYADLDERLFYVRLNGSDWHGESGAGSSIDDVVGVDISYLGPMVFPYADIRMDAGGCIVGRFSPSLWQFAPPPGASEWVGGGTPPAVVIEFDTGKTTPHVTLSGTPALVATATGTTVSGDGAAVVDEAFHGTGKYYWEVELTTRAGGGTNTGSGIISATFTMGTDGFLGGDNLSMCYYTTGDIFKGGSSVGAGGVIAAGSVIGHILDLDANTLQFTKDGALTGIAHSIASINVSGGAGPAIDFEGGEAGSVWTANFGTEGEFKYLAPVGYLRLDGTDPLRQVWDPANTAASLTVDPTYLMTTSVDQPGNAFGRLARTSGKIAWKITITTYPGGAGGCGVGVTNTYSISGSLLGGSVDDIICFSDGNVYYNSAAVGTVGTLTTSGDVVHCAMDLDASPRRIWFKKNAGGWRGPGGAGDPGTPSTGFDISSITGPIFVASDNREVGIVMTADFLDDSAWPAGYGGWV